MRKKLIVANWKMHLNTAQSSLLLHRLNNKIRNHREIEVVLAPSTLVLQPLSLQIDRRKFRLCAQDAFYIDEGPYTGEVSFTMLRDIVHYSIIGHSSRRLYFREDLEVVRDKVAACVRNGIIPILCVGETKQEKRLGEAKQVLHDQIYTALSNLTSSEIEDMVITYEPVWAISTNEGENARPIDVKQSIDFIRLEIKEMYGQKAAEQVRVLYGGSVNDGDVGAYLEIDGCDGVLVGAASLNYLQFSSIVETAYKISIKQIGDT